MKITDLPTNWRNKYKQAQFRWAIFYVDSDGRQGGRRVALHQYPKRSVPYAEDMGRTANRFTVQGYLIGQGIKEGIGSYLTLKDNLITCLEQDGPGMLRLPLPFQSKDVKVMVQGYTISESRERGGICTVEMDFVEYGDPNYRSTISTPGEINKSASSVEKAAENAGADATTPAEVAEQVDPYDKAYLDAMKLVDTGAPQQ